MRGEIIQEPITIAELAELCDLSESHVRSFVTAGYLKVDRTSRPMLVTGGFVPIPERDFRNEVRNAVPEARRHMIGFEPGAVHVLVRDAVKVIATAERMDVLRHKVSEIRALLGLDRAEPAE